jgi:hypothetical protein
LNTVQNSFPGTVWKFLYFGGAIVFKYLRTEVFIRVKIHVVTFWVMTPCRSQATEDPVALKLEAVSSSEILAYFYQKIILLKV